MGVTIRSFVRLDAAKCGIHHVGCVDDRTVSFNTILPFIIFVNHLSGGIDGVTSKTYINVLEVNEKVINSFIHSFIHSFN